MSPLESMMLLAESPYEAIRAREDVQPLFRKHPATLPGGLTTGWSSAADIGDSLDFGLMECRRAVPHLQRMLGHLETSLKELERAVGI